MLHCNAYNLPGRTQQCLFRCDWEQVGGFFLFLTSFVCRLDVQLLSRYDCQDLAQETSVWSVRHFPRLSWGALPKASDCCKAA